MLMAGAAPGRTEADDAELRPVGKAEKVRLPGDREPWPAAESGLGPTQLEDEAGRVARRGIDRHRHQTHPVALTAAAALSIGLVALGIPSEILAGAALDRRNRALVAAAVRTRIDAWETCSVVPGTAYSSLWGQG
jgi:hypothetical protein